MPIQFQNSVKSRQKTRNKHGIDTTRINLEEYGYIPSFWERRRRDIFVLLEIAAGVILVVYLS
ncbi:MAG: hypothetical protein AAF705_19950, partial [Bacteroidota bacterium]